jgi:hypothetical protein
MTKPVRLTLSRRRGFNLERLSEATNGLPAVYVGRPSKWGNPYIVGRMTPKEAVAGYRDQWLPYRMSRGLAPLELRGKNLACFCKPGEPCHADVLLELANA